MDENEKITDAELLDELTPVVSNQEMGLTHGNATDFLALREELVEKYHSNSKSLFDKINKKPDGSSVEAIISTALEELIRETDNLLGNELSLLQQGCARDSSVISTKRADVLETLSRVAVKKQELMKNMSKVDFNSPAFQIFQGICFDKLTEVMEELSVDNELKQLLVIKWGEKMENWDKELKDKLDSLSSS